MSFSPDAIRPQFPALSMEDDGRPRYYFDNPAGTQVPQMVVDRMAECMLERSANLGGYFRTSKLAVEVEQDAHQAMADLLNAESPDEIIFGQNMTTITFHVARSIGRTLNAGDEIVLSRMDHDANVQPWVMLARDLDLVVRWLDFDHDTFEFDLSLLDGLLNEKTRLVCIGGASNMTGTIHDIETICRKTREAGAWSYIDAVQSVPHVSTDVQKIGCDFLVCSAYKFFGPHQGMLYGRREILESLEPYKVRPAPDELPWRFETGTQSHEGMAGTAAAVDYFAEIGAAHGADYEARYPDFSGRRLHVHTAMDCLFDYETRIAKQLIDGLTDIPGIRVLGITDDDALQRRVPTVSFIHESAKPSDIAEKLAAENIFVWSGHNYALEAASVLGILDRGGAVRVGPVHYNTPNEISTLLNALQSILD